MSENGQLPQIVSATSSRFRTPAVAIVLTAAVTLGLALFSTFISALTISAIVRLIAYASTCAALLALRRNHELPRPPFVVPVGPLIAIIAVGLSIWLISNSPWGEMRVAGIAVALGLVLYCVWGRRSPEARQASAAALS